MSYNKCENCKSTYSGEINRCPICGSTRRIYHRNNHDELLDFSDKPKGIIKTLFWILIKILRRATSYSELSYRK